MRVPEISLGYGLLAQNKHDLCRYYKYTERHKQTQYLPAYTVSFMVVPSVRAWEFRVEVSAIAVNLNCCQSFRKGNDLIVTSIPGCVYYSVQWIKGRAGCLFSETKLKYQKKQNQN